MRAMGEMRYVRHAWGEDRIGLLTREDRGWAFYRFCPICKSQIQEFDRVDRSEARQGG
jgi:hypothetical protein